MDSATLAAHEEATRVKTVNKIYFGGQEIDTWYFSPYPAEAQATDLHICEFCLSFFLKASELLTHSLRCTVRHPQGNEIYRDGQSVASEHSQAPAAADGWCGRGHAERCNVQDLYNWAAKQEPGPLVRLPLRLLFLEQQFAAHTSTSVPAAGVKDFQ